MKRFLLFALATTLCAVAVVSCKKDDGETALIVLNGRTDTTLTAYADQTAGGGFSFTAKDSWTLTAEETPTAGDTAEDETGVSASGTAWLTLKENGGEKYEGGAGTFDFSIELQKNYTGQTRRAAITITSAAESVSITVIQLNTTESGNILRETSGAVYHEGIGAWIVSQNDPYALENFQEAYDNLASGKSQQLPAGSQKDEFSGTRTLTATHYALKVFPRNEDEQWRIELMEGVRVSYIPFDYVALTEQEAGGMGTPEGKLFEEVNPHKAAYDMRTVEDATIEEVAWSLPIVYAVWPVGKPLPDDMDYEMDYEVYLPGSDPAATRGAATMSETALRLLENEAIRLALGRPASPEPETRGPETVLSGEFWMWEVLQVIKVPVPGIKVRFHLGSNVVEADVDADGYFSVAAASIPADASWDILFQNPKWKLTREDSTLPKCLVQGAVYQANYWSDTNTHVSATIQPFDATIIKSLYYFYYKSHIIPQWEDAGGIHVIANNNPDGSYLGLFSYASDNSCKITIYRSNTVNRNLLAGTVLHEMGHFVHFKERGGTYNNFTYVDNFLKESFACYVGWYLVEKYYAELGYIKGLGEDISGQGRQSAWTKTLTGYYGNYSPFFVDLVDDFNQASYFGNTYNDDRVKGLHYSVIMKIARESTYWADCKSKLRENSTLVNQGLETFLEPYDYWFSNK